MEHPDRRTNQRIPAEFKVNYIHDGDYLISHSRDLSVDGMFIFTKNPPPVGDTPKLNFSLENLPEISLTAKVVWTNNDISDKDAGMGVQFIDPPRELIEAIKVIVNKVAVFSD